MKRQRYTTPERERIAKYILEKHRAALKALAATLIFVLVGCTPAQPKQVVQYQTVEVPRYVRTPVPSQYLHDCIVVEPVPAAGKWFTNGQVAVLIDDYRSALRLCNADKAAIRLLQPQPETTP